MTDRDPDSEARQVSVQALGRADATGWFEELYAGAARGEAVVPWDVNPFQVLVEDWATRRGDGTGRTAIVVGCGTGRDAELIASLGYAATAFDVAPSAIAEARRRHPQSEVDYVAADLFDLPVEWQRGYDLVVESLTVQSLPVPLRERAIRQVTTLVAPGGTLLVVSGARLGPADAAFLESGPPWRLDRAEVERFADTSVSPPLVIESIELITDPTDPAVHRWRAVFTRGSASQH